MPTLKLVIVPAKILSDGKHKVRISVSHNSQTRYIPTDCIIDDLSQFKEGQVVNRSDASYMNMKLRKKLIFYQETLDKIYDPDLYTCTDLVTLLLQKKDYRGITFSQKADEYITQLIDNGQGKSAKLYRNAVNSFLKSQRDVNLAAMSPTNIRTFEQYMKQKRLSSTTMNIYLTLIQCIINSAKKHKEVIYETEPFEFCNKPSINSRELDLSVEELKTIRDIKIDKYNVNVFDGTGKPSGGSTDVGDVQHIQPVFTFNTGGASGSGLHSVDFDIDDEELAYIVTAKIFALTAYRFLKGGAEAARRLVDDYKPVFTKQEYIDFMESMISVKTGGEPHFDTRK